MSWGSQTQFALPPVLPPLCHGAFSVDPRTESDPGLSVCWGSFLPPMPAFVTYLIRAAEEENMRERSVEEGIWVEMSPFSAWLKEFFKSTDAELYKEIKSPENITILNNFFRKKPRHKDAHADWIIMSRKKGQNNVLTTCSNFYMQAIFEVISIVVCLFISTKAADRLPRDPKENCLRGRQKLSTSSCKHLFEEENKFPSREVDMPADELCFKYETQTLGGSLLQTHP